MIYTSATPYIASFVIVRRGSQVAFVLREHTKWMNGYFGLPSGKVEKNEAFTTAAIREAKEEIGITVKATDLKHVLTLHRHEPSNIATDWVDVYFEALKWEGEPVNNEPKVHAVLEWLDIGNLPENVVPSVRFGLGQIQAGKMYSEYGWNET